MSTNNSSLLGYILLSVVGVGIVIGAGSYGYSLVERLLQHQEEQRKAEQWQELRRAVLLAGTPLAEDPPSNVRDYKDQVSRFMAIHNAGNLDVKNPELIKVWAHIEASAETGLMILQRIGEIERDKPSGYELFAKYVTSDENSSHEFWPALADRLRREADKSRLEAQFRETELNLNSAAGELQAVANGLSHKDRTGGISVEYTPSWQGIFLGDTVEVRNTSDQVLEPALLFVTVRMKGGASNVHIHYTNQWQSGTTLKALYRYLPTDYANSQTGSDPENVEAAIYLPNGTAVASHLISSEEWDKKVRGYCSGLRFGGNYLAAYADDSGQRFNAGFQFQFQGLPMLPVKSLEVRFTSPTGEIQSATGNYDPGSRLKSGEPYPLRSPQLDGVQPSHIDYVLSFWGTNYQHQLHLY